MSVKGSKAISWVLSGVLAAGGSLLGACGDDNGGGSTDASTDGTTRSDGGGGDGGSSLYLRLGGKAGIEGAVTAIVDEELKDTEIASYFTRAGGLTNPGSPTRPQIEACLVKQLSDKSISGGPETYADGVAITVDGGSTWTCRTMAAAHANLGIPGGLFDRFVSIAAGVLTKAGVGASDVASIGSVLVSTKSAIVTDSNRDSGPFVPDGGGT